MSVSRQRVDPHVPPGGGGGGGGLQPFPGTGGGGGGPLIPSAAGPFGSGPATNPLVAARSAPSLKPNPENLPSQAWKSIEVDRPSILWVAAGITTNAIYYTCEAIPTTKTVTSGVSVPTLGGAASFADPVQISVRHGICYLSGPGRWWIYNAGSTNVEALVLDASDPAVAARYLNEPGSAKWSNTTQVTVNSTSTLLVSDSRSRAATILQHTAKDGTGAVSAADVWLSMEATAVVGNGLWLPPQGILTLTDELNYRGRIRAISSSGTVRVAVQEVTA